MNRYCCSGLTAEFKFPVKPITVEGIHFKRAVYQCNTCGAITIRADAVQFKDWSTVITSINLQEYELLKEERRAYEQQVRTVPSLP